MKKDLSLWQFIENKLKSGQAVMLLVVTESKGSSPGRQGFKMALSEDGEMTGSIGGGIMEKKLIELARKRLKENISEPLLKKQIHSKSARRHQSGLMCSGEQTVIYFNLNQDHLADIQKVIRMSGKYQSAILHISSSNGVNNFTVTDGVLDELKYEFATGGEEEFVYRENIGYKYRLYIVGGGHCALALSELMSKFDFYITVMDDRPWLNTMEQNIFANEKYVLESYEKVVDIIPSGPDVFVVVMTLGHRSDTVALLQLLDKKFAYLGSLGSDTKIDTIKENLRHAGIAETTLKEIHAPIGLKINSHSAEEIALSIAAEIIQVRNSE